MALQQKRIRQESCLGTLRRIANKGDRRARAEVLSQTKSEEAKANLYRRWKVDINNVCRISIQPQL